MPMIRVLEWTEGNDDSSEERPGKEWMGDVLYKACRGKPDGDALRYGECTVTRGCDFGFFVLCAAEISVVGQTAVEVAPPVAVAKAEEVFADGTLFWPVEMRWDACFR